MPSQTNRENLAKAIANVKISTDPAVVGNAIKCFLDRDRSELTRVSRETLEGYLRGVVATLTPEDLNEDRLSFAERIASDVSRDLTKLGLQLDTLKIQSVSDDVDYLSSLGRKQIALIIRDAEIVCQFLESVDKTLGIDVVGTLNQSNRTKLLSTKSTEH